MPRLGSLSLVLLTALCLVAACGGGGAQNGEANNAASSSSASNSPSSCNNLAAAARSDVEAAISANLSCTTDSDCIDTGFSASCFSFCTHPVKKSGVAAVDAARAKVDNGSCATFKEQGCKAIIPPCPPPEKPACVKGRCGP